VRPGQHDRWRWPSTPASYFHLLRWQALSELVRPLIVFTPKSLPPAKTAVSRKVDFTSGHFRAVIPDETVDPAQVRTVPVQRQGQLRPDGPASRAAAQ
jgi:2-oxoglutarate dehydrogenase E1 component